jgi:hypothetical protein
MRQDADWNACNADRMQPTARKRNASPRGEQLNRAFQIWRQRGETYRWELDHTPNLMRPNSANINKRGVIDTVRHFSK